MPGKKISYQFAIILAILAVGILMTATGAAAQHEKVLHSFGSSSEDGFYPTAGLISDASGNLYGVTLWGGPYGSGTVFELSPMPGGGWSEKIIHGFNHTNGANPYGTLLLDAHGNLYGTTSVGGAHSYGTAFELRLSPSGVWVEKVLYDFADGTDGGYPGSGMIMDSAGNLYGTCESGGALNAGVVFELSPSSGGTWKEKVIYSFNGPDGTTPVGALAFDGAGNLYGATYVGGTNGDGSVYELTPAAHGAWTETVLHSFSQYVDGGGLLSGVLLDASGNVYGAAAFLGCCGGGTVFEFTSAGGGVWNESLLYSFSGPGSEGPNGIIFDAAGNLFGPLNTGGSNNDGAVFELTPAGGGSWSETTVYNFGSGTDGVNPNGGLVLDASGDIYGTTYDGGAYGAGTLFEIRP
jgi:uncharacterized repeat protein (TIGR03803 family)